MGRLVEYGHLVAAGFLLIFLGVALVFLGVFLAALSGGKGGVEAGGVVFIGPVPLVFGTSGKAALAAVVLAIVMLLVTLAIMLRFFKP